MQQHACTASQCPPNASVSAPFCPPTCKVVPQALRQRCRQLLSCPQQRPLLAGLGQRAKLPVLAGALQREQQHQQLLQLPNHRLARGRKALKSGPIIGRTGPAAGGRTALTAHCQRRRPVRCREALLDGAAEQGAQALLHRIQSRQQAGCVLLQSLDGHLALLCARWGQEQAGGEQKAGIILTLAGRQSGSTAAAAKPCANPYAMAGIRAVVPTCQLLHGNRIAHCVAEPITCLAQRLQQCRRLCAACCSPRRRLLLQRTDGFVQVPDQRLQLLQGRMAPKRCVVSPQQQCKYTSTGVIFNKPNMRGPSWMQLLSHECTGSTK